MFIRALAISFTTAVIVKAAVAQSSPHPLVEAFDFACLQKNSFSSQSESFKQLGWSIAPKDFDELASQDILEPSEVRVYAKDVPGGGRFLASTVRGSKGVWPLKRNYAVCLTRMWVEDFASAREDMRTRQKRVPDHVTNSSEVTADSWFEPLSGEVISMRAILTGRGTAMVTLTRFSKEIE